MNVKKAYQLTNGVWIPSVGFGTWQIPAGPIATQATREALIAGYRHIDTAAIYQNEESVGLAIRESGLKREEVFVTSKLRADRKGYQITLDEFYGSLNRLGLDYLDLFLIHWPKPWGVEGDGKEYESQNIECWKAFIQLHKEGKIRAIGVSNFYPMHLEPLIEATGFVPHVNQIPIWPGYLQTETVTFAEKHSIQIEAYSPLATGRLFQVPEIHEIANRYHKTPAQIALRWSLQHGFLPLPKSVNKERIISNLELFDFEISPEDMVMINQFSVPPKKKS
ncbi:MAG: aldo/keto reductase [Acholeplasmataceae bacterium]|nr:aldo/keto reductase [Acholeplasmataceae bacterium]